MKKKEIFCEMTFKILTALDKEFPIPQKLELDMVLDTMAEHPRHPVRESTFARGKGVEVLQVDKPDAGFWLEESVGLFSSEDFEKCLMVCEEEIGRSLNDLERQNLKKLGVRPYTEKEEEAILEYKAQRKDYLEMREVEEEFRPIFNSTILFLASEGFIRVVDYSGKHHEQGVDSLVSNRSKSLHFSLTSKGFSRLNSNPFKSSGKTSSLIKQMTKYTSDKVVGAATETGAQNLLSMLLS
jgi:hypothetical protein